MRSIMSILTVLAVLALATAAQPAPAPTVAVSEEGDYGAHLVDAAGMSLYLYAEDEGGQSSCYDACARNWQPLLVEGEPVAGEGADAALLGTTKRKDGTLQATYNGHPLYTYARDAKPGDTRGANLGDVFFLVSADGQRVTEKAPPKVAQVSDEVFADLMATGEHEFSTICSTCHGDHGQGKIGPAFDGNADLARTEYVIDRILNGFIEHGMPSFRDQFTDHQVAGVATYVRNSWSNDFGPVTEEEVAKLR